MSHTPGDWEYSYGVVRTTYTVGEHEHNQYRALICAVSNCENDAEMESNGYLLAASPKLLEECEDALGYFESAWASTGNHPASSFGSYVRGLRAAIAKAKGEDNA